MTAEELYLELDAFMKNDTKPAEAPAAAPATVIEEESDVDWCDVLPVRFSRVRNMCLLVFCIFHLCPTLNVY